MNKKLIGYALFFVALVLAFYFFLFRGNDSWKTKLPVISYVKPFRFTTQDGQAYTDKDMMGKVSVVEYFFTTCKGICPKLNTSLRTLYDQFRNEPDFMIVAHTCDPETDSSARLKFYADSMKIDTHKWVLLTGRKDSLYQAARNSYLLDDPKNDLEKIQDQFIHTQFFALVDREGKVRGQVYDGLKKAEIETLKKDIAALLAEKPSGGSVISGILNK
ncbi:MAG: SCO1/SenC family lipoprotein [Sediminibacterium sp.]|nr:SCO1/SenC family lipoprotein [Sediminibacterium sp.]